MFVEETLYLPIPDGHAEAEGSEAVAERLRSGTSQMKKPYEKPTLQKMIVRGEEFSVEGDSPRYGSPGRVRQPVGT